jgi:hypothetical protein
MTEENVASEEAEIKTTANDNIVQLSLVEKQKASSDLLTIVVEGGSLSDNVRSAERALARANRRDPGNGVYQRPDGLVRLARLNEVCKDQGVDRPEQTMRIEPAGPSYLRYRLGDVASWVRIGEEGPAPSDPPMPVASTLTALGDWPNTLPLTGIVEAPTMRPDGTVIDTPGYDPATGLFFDPGRVKFPPVPELPSKKDAEKALALLLDTVSEFPFVSEAAQSVSVSCIMTPLIRPAVATAPLFVFDAPTPGTGKGMNTRIPAWIATGRGPSMLGNWSDSGEDKRRLLAVMLEALQVVVIDNVNETLKSDTLCTILTEGQIRDRVIRSSTTATGKARLTWIATGNNIVIGGDLPRRSLVCRMDAKMEKPETRTFKRENLEAYTGRANLKTVGKLFVRHTGRIFSGLRIDRVGERQKIALWAVTAMS